MEAAVVCTVIAPLQQFLAGRPWQAVALNEAGVGRSVGRSGPSHRRSTYGWLRTLRMCSPRNFKRLTDRLYIMSRGSSTSDHTAARARIPWRPVPRLVWKGRLEVADHASYWK